MEELLLIKIKTLISTGKCMRVLNRNNFYNRCMDSHYKKLKIIKKKNVKRELKDVEGLLERRNKNISRAYIFQKHGKNNIFIFYWHLY
jgi:hypothetical protein